VVGPGKVSNRLERYVPAIILISLLYQTKRHP
jgi:hypothetical protein